jgi:predicted membrane protein
MTWKEWWADLGGICLGFAFWLIGGAIIGYLFTQTWVGKAYVIAYYLFMLGGLMYGIHVMWKGWRKNVAAKREAKIIEEERQRWLKDRNSTQKR